ncbi:spore germination protein [Paenibacillus algorifonticola]|uniref:spore germination protein n=1 Tax=Paenibacillus algorifonticola TaxID=684063 RepID=UPI003D2E20A5
MSWNQQEKGGLPQEKITTIQVAVIISNFMLGSGILSLPRVAAEKVGTPDAWISVILGGLVAIVAGGIMALLSQAYPGQTFYEYSRKIVGSWLGHLLGPVMILYFAATAAFQVRSLAEVSSFILLEGTPQWAITSVFLWVGLYLMLGGLGAIARLFELILPLSIFIYLLVLLMGFKIFDLDNLRPLLGQGIWPVLKGVQTTSLAFTGFEVIILLTAYMKNPKQNIKAVTAGIAVPLVIYIVTVFMVIGALSVDGTLTKNWPTLDMARSFELSGLIFERFEFLLLIIWIMQIFSSFSTAFYCSALGISQLYKRKMKTCLYGLLPFVYIFVAVPKKLNDVFMLGDWIGKVALYLFGVIPIVLLIVTKWRSSKHAN